MNIKVDLDPTLWRSQPAIDPTHRSRKQRLTRVQAVAVMWFCAGLLLGVLV